MVYVIKLNNNNNGFENFKIYEYLNILFIGCCIQNEFVVIMRKFKKKGNMIKKDYFKYCVDVKEYNLSIIY